MTAAFSPPAAASSSLLDARSDGIVQTVTIESSLVARAAAFAKLAHRGQVRKEANGGPYFVHPEGVARLLQEHGVTDEVVLAAAYLHDVIEDQPAWTQELRTQFPRDVVATVELVTERKLDAAGRRRPKGERFAEYLAALRGDAPQVEQARLVSCADKVHNLQTLLVAERAGDHLLERLNTPPDQYPVQLSALRDVYATTVPTPLLETFDRTVRQLLAYLEEREHA